MTVTRVEAGPRRVSYRVDVGRPVEELFALAADPHRHSDLDGSGTVGAAITGLRRVRQGDRFAVRSGHRWRWEFEPTATGTRVTETFDHSRLDGVRATLLELVRAPQRNARGIRATLAGLAR